MSMMAIIIEQVTQNKSSLLLKIILQNTQTLQLFMKIIRTEIISKSNLFAKLEGLAGETFWSN
jgi:hypothetical protein